MFWFFIGKRCKDVGDADREDNKSNYDIYKYLPSNESLSTSLFVWGFFSFFNVGGGGGVSFFFHWKDGSLKMP